MDQLEERNVNRVIEPIEKESNFQKIAVYTIGVLFLIGGIAMHFLMRSEGLIGTPPLIMFGIGLAILFGGMKS